MERYIVALADFNDGTVEQKMVQAYSELKAVLEVLGYEDDGRFQSMLAVQTHLAKLECFISVYEL